jgi:hypothetical protein
MGLELRAAEVADAAFLTDVVIETTRDQGRLARDFDEDAFRRLYEQWSATQVDTTSVIEVDEVPAGRLRVVRTPGSSCCRRTRASASAASCSRG